MVVNNILRALAIIAVIVIHTAAAQTLFLHQHNLSAPDYFLTLDLLVRFSVPLFVVLSGFGLAKSFNGKLFSFYLRRVTKLLPWYLFWGTIIYFYLYGHFPNWTLFVSGQIDYHLYFVPMIFTLYLIFPLLWLAVKKFPWPTLLLAFFWQVYLYRQLDRTILSDQQQYIQAASWIFYFVLGIFLGNKEEILKSKRWLAPAALTLTIGGFFYLRQNSLGLKNIDIDPIIFTRFTQIPVLFYATGVTLSGLFILPKFISRVPSFLTTFLSSLGKHSYQIYLCHTLILRLAIRNLDVFTRLPFLLSLSVVLVGAYGVSLITGQLVKVVTHRVWPLSR